MLLLLIIIIIRRQGCFRSDSDSKGREGKGRKLVVPLKFAGHTTLQFCPLNFNSNSNSLDLVRYQRRVMGWDGVEVSWVHKVLLRVIGTFSDWATGAAVAAAACTSYLALGADEHTYLVSLSLASAKFFPIWSNYQGAKNMAPKQRKTKKSCTLKSCRLWSCVCGAKIENKIMSYIQKLISHQLVCQQPT